MGGSNYINFINRGTLLYSIVLKLQHNQFIWSIENKLIHTIYYVFYFIFIVEKKYLLIIYFETIAIKCRVRGIVISRVIVDDIEYVLL